MDGGTVIRINRTIEMEEIKKSAYAHYSSMSNKKKKRFADQWLILESAWTEPLSIPPGAKLSMIETAITGSSVTNGEFRQRKAFWEEVKVLVETNPEKQSDPKKRITWTRWLVDAKKQAKELVREFLTKEKENVDSLEVYIAIDYSTGKLLYVAVGEIEGNSVAELFCDESIERKNVMDILRYGTSVPLKKYIGNDLV